MASEKLRKFGTVRASEEIVSPADIASIVKVKGSLDTEDPVEEDTCIVIDESPNGIRGHFYKHSAGWVDLNSYPEEWTGTSIGDVQIKSVELESVEDKAIGQFTWTDRSDDGRELVESEIAIVVKSDKPDGETLIYKTNEFGVGTEHSVQILLPLSVGDYTSAEMVFALKRHFADGSCLVSTFNKII